MKTALVISSFVGASHVGASVSAFCLRRLGINVFVLPTTLFGRHPGWGAPGGQAVDASLIDDMWTGLRAQNVKIDAVLTGYMASAAQVKVAAGIIENVRSDNNNAQIIVDPVMGDHGRLYVAPQVASDIIERLVSAADVMTPNLWELGHICGQELTALPETIRALEKYGRSALVSSVPFEHDIGALIYNGQNTHLVCHEKFEKVPHGGGDALAGAFLAHLLNGKSQEDSLARSVSSIFKILSLAAQRGQMDLPLIEFQDALISADPLHIERLPLA